MYASPTRWVTPWKVAIGTPKLLALARVVGGHEERLLGDPVLDGTDAKGGAIDQIAKDLLALVRTAEHVGRSHRRVGRARAAKAAGHWCPAAHRGARLRPWDRPAARGSRRLRCERER